MLGFSPFKKHANKFNYTPRYYDPDRERLAQRRRELRGEEPGQAEGEYVPGQYLRTAHARRAERRAEEKARSGRQRLWLMLGGAVVILLFLAAAYPRILMLLRTPRTAAAPSAETVQPVAPAAERDPFDQSGISDEEWTYRQIEVVPNDYSGE